MRWLIVRNDGLEQRLTLVGLNIDIMLEKRVNQHNIVIIDKSFQHDATLRFPEYIFEVSKIMTSYSRNRLNKIFELNNDFIYNRPRNKDFINDLIILSRKDSFKKMSIPHIDKTGKIRLTHMNYSDNLANNFTILQNLDDYEKLRIVIFNTVTLPYLKSIIF